MVEEGKINQIILWRNCGGDFGTTQFSVNGNSMAVVCHSLIEL